MLLSSVLRIGARRNAFGGEVTSHAQHPHRWGPSATSVLSQTTQGVRMVTPLSVSTISCASFHDLQRRTNKLRSSVALLRHGGHHHIPIIPAGKEASEEAKKEAQLATRITYLGLLTNVAFGVGKGVAGVVGQSSAMIADATHSLTDAISDLITLLTVKISRRQPTSQYPYGFGRYETLGGLAVSSLLVTAGIGLVHHAFEHMMHSGHTIPSNWALYGAIGSIVLKELLYQWTNNIGTKQHSKLLIANAWHHRSDAISTAIALLGVLGAQMGFPYLDPIAGICVAGYIASIGLRTGYESVKELTDAVTDDSLVPHIEQIATGVNGVVNCRRIRTRHLGHRTIVEVTITVLPDIAVREARGVVRGVEEQILTKVPRVEEVIVSILAEGIDTEESNSNL